MASSSHEPSSASSTSRRRALFIIFLTVFIDLLGFGIVMPLLSQYAFRLHASPGAIGMLMASFSAMQFVFAPLWGQLSDRIGRRPVLLAGLAGSVVFYGLFGYASLLGSLPLLFVARVGAGIACATIPTAQAFIADSTSSEQRTGGMAIIGAAFGIGFTFGPLIGAAALQADPVRERAQLPPKQQIRQAMHVADNKAVDSTSPHSSVDTAPPESASGTASLSPMPGIFAATLSAIALLLAIFLLPESLQPGNQAPRHGWLDLGQWRAARAAPEVGNLIVLFALATFVFAMFESTIALLCVQALNMSEARNFYLFAYIGLLLTLAQGFLVRRLSKRVPDEVLAPVGIVLLAVGMMGLAAASLVGETWLLMTVLPILITGFALMTTAIQALISRRAPADQQGSILGLNQSGSALARIFGPYLGNVLLGWHLTYPYALGALLLPIALLMILRLPKASPSEIEATSGTA